MTGRDRIVVMVLAVLAVAAAGWILAVSPKRKEVKTYEGQVTSAQTQLSTARSQLADAKAAQARYTSSYAALVRLGKAVPPSQEVASLVYELEQVSNRRSVSFNSIASTGSSPGAAPAAAAATTTASAAFTAMPFTFIFSGGYFSLEHLFHGLTSFTTHSSEGNLEVSGRLLTIQSVKLTPETSTSPGKSAKNPTLSGTVTASAYVLPAGQALTAGATSTSPTGAAATAPASSTGSTSPTAPAVAKVLP
ncbi:MAG TPA: type II secretion system protein GspM [Solirubrobacteraceae bacterium]